MPNPADAEVVWPAEIVRERRYATTSGAAEYAACNPATLRKLVNDGVLTEYRLGRDRRIDLNELDALLENGASSARKAG